MAELQIPYVISGGFGLYERSEIEDILSFLKLLVQPDDDYSVVKLLTGPLYGLNDSDLVKLSLEGKFEKIRLLPRILAMKEEDFKKANEILGMDWSDKSKRQEYIKKPITDVSNIFDLYKETLKESKGTTVNIMKEKDER